MDPKELALRRLIVEVALTSYEATRIAPGRRTPAGLLRARQARTWTTVFEHVVNLSADAIQVDDVEINALVDHVGHARQLADVVDPDTIQYANEVMVALSALPGKPMVIKRRKPVLPDQRKTVQANVIARAAAPKR